MIIKRTCSNMDDYDIRLIRLYHLPCFIIMYLRNYFVISVLPERERERAMCMFTIREQCVNFYTVFDVLKILKYVGFK